MKNFRSSGSFGKRQEYVAVAELLKREYDVYMTLVDDQQIDCVVRIEINDEPICLDLQIKVRSKHAKQPGTFATLDVRRPRTNFIYVFYSEAADAYWVMPSNHFVDEATQNKSGANAGHHTIVLTSRHKDGLVHPRPRFDSWLENWDSLETIAQDLAASLRTEGTNG